MRVFDVLLVIGATSLCAFALADQPAKKRVDVGDLDVVGEIRRPPIALVDAGQAEAARIENLRMALARVEARLTHPSLPTETSGR